MIVSTHSMYHSLTGASMQQSQIKYNRAMMQVMKLVREDVEATLIPLIKRSVPEYIGDAQWPDIIANALRSLTVRWTSPFAQRQAERIAETFVKSAAGDNERKAKSFGIDLYGGDSDLQDYIKAAAFQNSQLIKSLPSRYLEQVQNIVVGNMRNGMRPSYIEQQLVKEFGVSQRRAKLIARDQHSKIQGDMNRIRQTKSGLKYFRWLTSHDDRVRHAHNVAGNKVTKYGKGVYSWDDLPIVDGVPTFPGQPIQCRCVSVPVLETQVERNKKAGKTDPAVKR